jgi:hypothetical protein
MLSDDFKCREAASTSDLGCRCKSAREYVSFADWQTVILIAVDRSRPKAVLDVSMN